MELKVHARTVTWKKVKLLRNEGVVPWILYGKSLKEPSLLKFDKQEFISLYNKAGYSTPLTLKWDGIDQLVLIHDIALDPVTDYVLHVDFLGLTKWEKVTAVVSIILEWNSLLEKTWEGRIQQVKSELEVNALPKNLPHDIKIDISKIESVNDVIFVKDLDIGNGVEILGDLDLPVVTVMAMSDEPEEEAVEETTETWEASVDWEAKDDGKEKEAGK